MKWRWSIALLPVVAGLIVVGLVTHVRTLSNPIAYVRADTATLSMIVGSLLSLLLAIGIALWGWAERNNRHAEDVRVRAAEEHRRFLQRLDHELKNPLTAIRAGLANIAMVSASPDQQATLASIETQVIRLGRLTADLRKLAELETRPLECAPIDVAELLHELVALAREQPQAVDRQLTLTLSQVPWPVSNVSGDWDMLFLALYNLIGNALKFTRAGDAIEIRAFEDGSSVVIEVADTGPGIPEDEVPSVWEELYRGQGARGIPGSGLGLALVRTIIDRHRGQVTLRSRVSQGTAMSVRLPVR
jgi:two-component system OmpR family sensor kinase